MAEEKKSSGFVLTKDGKAAIFKQNDGFKLKIKSFALFKDKTNKLRKLIEDSGFDYSVLENLEYSFFNNDSFELKPYNDLLKAEQRIENGKKILSLEVDIFNKNETDDTIYDGIIYFCSPYENGTIENISEEQDNNTIYAIQYFYKNKINIKASQDPKISFSIQIRFTQNNYEVIDLKLPTSLNNGLRLYNDADSNNTLRSKTLGTTKALTIGNNQNEIGSIVDIYADDGKNQVRLMSLDGNEIKNEIDVSFANDSFSISGNDQTKNVSLFSKDNTENNNVSAFYGFSNGNELTASTGTFVFQNSNENKVTGASTGSTYLNSNTNESTGGKNTFINSNNNKNTSEDVFINSNSLASTGGKHNTFLNTNTGTFNNVSNFVSLGGYNYNFSNVSNSTVIGHDLSGTDINDVVVFGHNNSTIDNKDIFVLANGAESKPNNAFKVNEDGEIIISDGTNTATISPTGIKVGDSDISYDDINTVLDAQNTAEIWKNEKGELEEKIKKVAANSITNMTLVIDSEYYKVDEHVPLEQRINNLIVSLYNPFENEVTVEYIYHQKTAITNPEEKIIKVVEVDRTSVLQLMFVETDDYKGFVIVE